MVRVRNRLLTGQVRFRCARSRAKRVPAPDSKTPPHSLELGFSSAYGVADKRVPSRFIPVHPLHFACAQTTFGCIVERMAPERNQEPGSRTAAYRNLLQREDLTMKMLRRRTAFTLVAAIAAVAVVGWLLAYFA